MLVIENDEVVDLHSIRQLVMLKSGIISSLLRRSTEEDARCEVVLEIVKLFVSEDLSCSVHLRPLLDLLGEEGMGPLRKEAEIFSKNCGLGKSARRVVRYILDYC